jgi:hypothetical protein
MSRRNTVVDPRVEAENNLRCARCIDNNSQHNIENFVKACEENGFTFDEFETSEEEIKQIFKNSAIYTAKYYPRAARQPDRYSHFKFSDAMRCINKYNLTFEEVDISENEIAALKRSYLMIDLLEKVKDVRTSNLLSLVDRTVLYFRIVKQCEENRLDVELLGTSKNELLRVIQQYCLKDAKKYLELIQSGITDTVVLESFRHLTTQLGFYPHNDLGLSEEELANILAM